MFSDELLPTLTPKYDASRRLHRNISPTTTPNQYQNQDREKISTVTSSCVQSLGVNRP